jgi:Tfp pilus assembly protein PilX
VFVRLLHRLRAAVGDERGFALVLALATSVVLTMLGTTIMLSTTQNQGQAARSKNDVTAHALAEAGLNNAMAILSKPSNDAMSAATLPSTEETASWERYDGAARTGGERSTRQPRRGPCTGKASREIRTAAVT